MKNKLQQQLGKKIQKLRKIKGYSQEKFAEQLGIATNTLSSIETGNAFMTAQTLEKISGLLGLSPGELFTFSDTVSEQDKYNYIIEKLEFFKSDNDRLNIIYNIVKALLL